MKFRQRKKNVRKFLVKKKKPWAGKGVQYIYQFNDGNIVSVLKFEVNVGGDNMGVIRSKSGIV